MTREVLCNIPTEFGIPMKLVRLIKTSLNKTYSKVCLMHFLLRKVKTALIKI